MMNLLLSPDTARLSGQRKLPGAVAAIAALLLLSSAMAQNADPAARVASAYPAGSIRTVESADQALAEAGKARAAVKERYTQEERACYGRFFASACIDDAKERRRAAFARIRPVEIEANAFKRQAKVDARDQALANRQAQDGGANPLDQSGNSARTDSAPGPSEAGKGAATETDAKERGQEPSKPQHSRAHKSMPEPDPDHVAAEAKKRAENVAAYERKIRKIQEHQREVEARKAEKNKKRADKEAARNP
ncbi:hypothetical protein [Noviherbaspirillum massiliense]|uniref:hypothetical protein n=1 Tax=Noviherbaspirillum massiliense TaxID=1465823 RepID=UPI000368A34C|nr:hypothetical protein [Noviherbaspirillum massiliense]